MKNNDIKVIFMGTPDFAKGCLEKLYDEGFNILACFTNPDKPAGRGMKVKYSAVKEYALSKDIPVYQPEKVRNNEEVVNFLKELKPDYLVVVAYGKILPKEILDIPKYAPINVHASLLPKYRGSAPMQWAIVNGESITGVTTMLMDIGMDTGDMLLKKEVKIEDNDNLETIHDKLMVVGADLLVKTLIDFTDGKIVPQKQGDDFSLAPMIKRETTKIDFNKNCREIFNFVRGFSPFPGTYVNTFDGKVFKIFDVGYEKSDEYSKFENGVVCFVDKSNLKIKCSDGVISIKVIQPQNSKRMDITAFNNGNKLEVGYNFI